ncbi:unnamed protein product [Eruca vesicaria subsp. sativa]|uniref:F-box domain-containing protein n=1 Tax=Eruca vesicaria subsp. sativa TaxID=29727 RepID=A0ABC8JJ11_ERUVS|nr:unnamed protein product [Eruca vesicaria subsp. sativa]
MDFVKNLDTDTSLLILSCLDDPSDLVHASAVSRSWREFVIRYGLSKNLCFKLFHQLNCVDRVNEESSWSSSSSLMDETKLPEREHMAFTFLAKGCTSSPIRSCIAEAIIASSTDNFPEESILETLDERYKIRGTPSYWSSSGHHNTSVPETLLYKLKGDLCVVTEFSIHPFQAYFQRGKPIYSSHYVRFRLGHLVNKSQENNNYVWTYTSQQFPMVQENRLQNFKLPEPVVCIGGYMLIEFLGRVQTQEGDGLYYICVRHVRVMGRSLGKSFRLVDLDESGKFGLNVVRSYCDPKEMGEEVVEQRPFRQMSTREFLNFIHEEPIDDFEYGWHEEEDGEEEDDAESDGEV